MNNNILNYKLDKIKKENIEELNSESNKNNTNNKINTNHKNNNINELENKTIFEKINDYFVSIDKKIIGTSGKEIIKKYKNEIVLILIILLFILIIIICYTDNNNYIKGKKTYNLIGGDEMGEGGTSRFSGLKSSLNRGVSGANSTVNAMKKPFKSFGNTLDRNREYIKGIVYDTVMFFIVFIVFMPSVSLLIILFVSFKILKPKVQYLKSL